ncbi:hypothetical protein [Clostridium butyricum]|uniref:hypothetical protein n=1 Tax=Clostridium butyricum TaxID=1492 RepID=UPI002AAF963F|nr:hypothetical protein [Clostridium butyricum]
MAELYKETVERKNKEMEEECIKANNFDEFNKSICYHTYENKDECKLRQKIIKIQYQIDSKRQTINNNEQLVNDPLW